MEGFKFDFGQNELSTSEKHDSVRQRSNLEISELLLSQSTVVNVSENHYKMISCVPKQSLTVGDDMIYLVTGGAIEEHLKVGESAISSAITSHSDLVPDIYEGGLKIWECSIDLGQYLSEHVAFDSKTEVLELGCGAGIPGILAHMKGACCVVFQDFNSEVLDLVCVPNVLLNTKNGASGCSFISGDWSVVETQISNISTGFDIILTSETIYNPSSYLKLLHLFKTFLKPTGCIYLAAKFCYFGVGGSISSFEDMVKKDGIFSIETCATFDEGVKRGILLLKFAK